MKKLIINKRNYFKTFENRILRQKKILLKYLNNFKDNVIGFELPKHNCASSSF